MKNKTQHSPTPWIIRPDYGQENVYRLWDENSNFHDDSGDTDVMDANALLMAAAPKLLAFAQLVAAGYLSHTGFVDAARRVLAEIEGA